MRRRVVTALAVVVVLALVVAAVLVWLRWWRDDDAPSAGSELQQAMSHTLPDAQRFSWTDWAAARSQLGVDLSLDSPVGQLARFLDRGFTADLTSTSALVSSAPVLQEHYGFSPATLDWELFSQSSTAAVVMMGLPTDADMGAVASSLRTIGYLQPSTPDGVWTGDLDDIKRVGDVTPELTFLSLDVEHHVILGSDTDTGLAEGLAAYRGGAAGQPVVEGLADVVAAVGSPTTAALYSSDGVCGELAMAHADPQDQATASDLIAQAGRVSPLTGFVMADEPGGSTTVAMGFESADQARENATTRAALASGPAPGQGGDFSDRFALGPVTADGLTVTMVLKPVPGSYVLSDLSTGPLLFATC